MNIPPCRQCRARKVRCDRRGFSCGPCTRLAVACSYSGNDPVNTLTPTSSVVSVSPSDDYTEAGLHRRRSRRACAVCRRAKAKCAGGAPCARCGAHGLACDGGDVTRPATATFSTAVPSLFSVSPTIRSPSETTSFSALDTATLRACVDAYFAAPGSGPAFPFLLKAAVLADWTAGRLHPLLLQCIAASGACLLGGQARHAAARAWMDAARRELLWHQLGRRPSLPLAQALVLLARFEQGGTGGNAIVLWNLLALAARFAFSLGLHHEHGPDMDPVVQETRRRAVWAIYALDRLVCGGIDDLAVCPAERMRIRLPCSELAFSRGEVSRAGFLSPGGDADDGDGIINDSGKNTPSPCEDFLAYYLRLLGHRHAILRHTKRLCFRNGGDPAAAAPARAALAAGLDAFVTAIPPALRVPSPQRLQLLAHASDAPWFLELHTLLLQCRVDLNRHAVPGLREALPPATLAQCPVAYTTACRRDCLAAATGLCNLWADAADTPGFPAVATASRSFFAFCFYHVARILLHLRAALEAPADEAAKLRRALVLIEGNKDTTAVTEETVPSKYVRDTRVLITVLAHGDPEAVARCVNGDKPTTQRYMPSRHSLLEKVSEEEPEGPEPASPAGEVPAPAYDWSVPALPLPDNLAGLPNLPWDVNGYYDPYLGDILLSMEV